MHKLEQGEVVKLDRGYPLVKLNDGRLVRAEHATNLVKHGSERAVIGDKVEVACNPEHDKAVIERILTRTNVLVRKDPTERALPQVLAANFDTVIIAQTLSEVNLRRLERELVLACETGARVMVVLTKADQTSDADLAASIQSQVQALAGTTIPTLLISADDARTLAALRDELAPGSTTVLIGRSGVGKSSLVNLLAGDTIQLTGDVREGDGKGRHTTVSRDMIELPNGARIVDMPGVRGLGLWEADAGIEATFADIADIATQCKFRDCKHSDEPGCAVRAAVEAGVISPERYASYTNLKQEISMVREKKRRASWKNR